MYHQPSQLSGLEKGGWENIQPPSISPILDGLEWLTVLGIFIWVWKSDWELFDPVKVPQFQKPCCYILYNSYNYLGEGEETSLGLLVNTAQKGPHSTWNLFR